MGYGAWPHGYNVPPLRGITRNSTRANAFACSLVLANGTIGDSHEQADQECEGRIHPW